VTSADQPPRRRSRRAKGHQPQFFEDPNTDKLLAIVTALAGELAVLKERLDTHERLAAAGQVATPEAIDAYAAEAAVEDAREHWRQGYLSRVFRVLELTQDEPSGPASEEEFDQVVTRFGTPE
jgi:hypothetical protein